MFEFDPAKSKANLAKHGIDFIEAQALWEDDQRIIGPASGASEERWMVVGEIADKLWSAIITFRGDNIRLISVRRARPMEAMYYERKDD